MAKSFRRVYRLVSLGLTILLIWTAVSVAFNPAAKNSVAKSIGNGVSKTEVATAGYIDSANGLHYLPGKAAKDIYASIAAPIQSWQQQRKHVADSLAQFLPVVEFAITSAAGEKLIFENPNRKSIGVERGEIKYQVFPSQTSVSYEVASDAHFFRFIAQGADIKVTPQAGGAREHRFLIE